MTNIQMSHVNIQGVNCAIFAADSPMRTPSARSALLARLTMAARAQGLAVEKSALAFASGRRMEFYGTDDLVRYLASSGLPRWTHQLTV